MVCVFAFLFGLALFDRLTILFIATEFFGYAFFRYLVSNFCRHKHHFITIFIHSDLFARPSLYSLVCVAIGGGLAAVNTRRIRHNSKITRRCKLNE